MAGSIPPQFPKGCDAVLLGPGMIDDEAVAAVTLALLTEVRGPAFVLDASAFTVMRKYGNVLQRQGGRVVVTPHAGEMAKFLNITRDEVEGTRSAQLARRLPLSGASSL